jgi:hypothetical protein
VLSKFHPSQPALGFAYCPSPLNSPEKTGQNGKLSISPLKTQIHHIYLSQKSNIPPEKTIFEQFPWKSMIDYSRRVRTSAEK